MIANTVNVDTRRLAAPTSIRAMKLDRSYGTGGVSMRGSLLVCQRLARLDRLGRLQLGAERGADGRVIVGRDLEVVPPGIGEVDREGEIVIEDRCRRDAATVAVGELERFDGAHERDEAVAIDTERDAVESDG